MFCPKCGSILVPKNKEKNRVLACSCGYVEKDKSKGEIREEISEGKKVEVVEKEEETHPLTDAQCPKCKHTKAHYWTVQTRASDEPETKFLKCQKCKNIWRDYS